MAAEKPKSLPSVETAFLINAEPRPVTPVWRDNHTSDKPLPSVETAFQINADSSRKQ